MVDFVVIAVIACILGGAAMYICKAKKKGQKCIGCPHAAKCGSCPCQK